VVASLGKLLAGLMRDRREGAEVTALCTMALEVVTVLFNPDVCLNPLLPAPQRVIDDCPSQQEVRQLPVVAGCWKHHWKSTLQTLNSRHASFVCSFALSVGK